MLEGSMFEEINNKLYNMLKNVIDLHKNYANLTLTINIDSDPIREEVCIGIDSPLIGLTDHLQKNNTSVKNLDEQYTLKIEGFKSKRQVEEFIRWYEGQGEQNAADWFDARMSEGKLDVDFMPVHIQETYPIQFNGNEGKMVLKISTSK